MGKDTRGWLTEKEMPMALEKKREGQIKTVKKCPGGMAVGEGAWCPSLAEGTTPLMVFGNLIKVTLAL